MMDESSVHGREDQAYLPRQGNIHQRDSGGLTEDVMKEYGKEKLESTNEKGGWLLNGRKESNDKKHEKTMAPAKDTVMASFVSNGPRLPAPNLQGSVGSVPLENIRPDDFKYAPSRKPNKYDTSMTQPGKLDTITEDNIKDAMKIDGTDSLFPWLHVANFAPSGRGRANIPDSKVAKAYILETFYNDWYYNISLIVGTCFMSWLFAYCGFSWWSLGFIFFCSGSVFASEYRRFTDSARDDLKRITVEETLFEKTETTLWLNSFLSKFWVIYMPVLSQQVKDVANPTLAGAAPGYGIEALSLEEFTLGSKSPSIKGIKSNTKAGKDIIEMILSFAFTPNDISDMTQREAKQMINPKITLGVTLGKSFVSKTLPVIVEDINVAGKMRVVIKLGQTFPNIKIVSVQLLEPPLMEFALKPIGGDTLGLDVMSFLPGLKTFVKTMINANVGPMLYAPHHLDIDVEELMAEQANDAVGVLAVTITSAQELDSSNTITNTLDPYIFFKAEKPSPGAQTDLCTTIKSDVKNPVWNETKYLLLNDLNQKLTISCFDFNDLRKDSLIGSVEVNLQEMLQNPVMKDMTSDLMHGLHSKGKLNYSMHWFPVIRENDETEANRENGVQYNKGNNKDADVDEKEEKQKKDKEPILDSAKNEEEDDQDEETDAGIIKITLQSIKHLTQRGTSSGRLSPSAVLTVDGKEVKKFRTLKRIDEPSWNETVEVFVPSRSNGEMSLKVFDEDRNKAPICTFTAPLEEALSSLELGQASVKGDPRGDIFMNLEWKPVRITGAFAAGNAVKEPIGALRVHVRDVNVVGDLAGIGDIDPYFTILVNGHINYKSSHFSENSHPMFNKVIYLPVIADNQNISIDVYDYQSVGKDRAIGGARIPIASVMQKDAKTGKYKAMDKSDEITKLYLENRKLKRREDYVNVSLSFVPISPVYSPEEAAVVVEKKRTLEQRKKEFEKTQSELQERKKQKPNDYEEVEIYDPFEEEEHMLSKKHILSLEELLKRNSGVLTMQIFKGQLSKSPAHLQIYVDEIAFPRYVSQKSINGRLSEGNASVFIRDLKNSKITFRLSQKRVAKQPSDVISEKTVETYKLLKESYGTGSRLTFNGSIIELSCLYSPSSVEIPPYDTCADTGYLKLKVISADNVVAKDRNGYSDPFYEIYIDGSKIYKSEIIKKTLSPVWNDIIDIPVPSRHRNKVEIHLFDWDRSGDNDDMGMVLLDLSTIEPDEGYNWELPISIQGTIKLQGTFHAEYIKPAVNANEIKKSGFASKTLGTISQTGIGSVKTGAVGVTNVGLDVATGGIDRGTRLLRRPFQRHEASKKMKNLTKEQKNELGHGERRSLSISEVRASLEADRSVPNNDYAPVQNLDPDTQRPIPDGSEPVDSIDGSNSVGTANHARNPSTVSSFARTLAPNGTYKGTVTIVAAEQLNKAVQIKISLAQGGRLKQLYKTKTQKADDKGVAKFDEKCSFKASPQANLIIGAISHHKLTKDKELGMAQIALSDPQLQQPGDQIAVKLSEGRIILRIDYATEANDEVPPVPSIPQQYQS
ncbi:hypothetical protein HG536_0C06010 [Torulaspora globosa]|uniref:Tricalbin n=1 Tax=Torulaspora globosa TaxID=48254 RepID=A0A7G3ZFZ6_9SACH|nr:uncharacterized protein HG536_0C06010 [Torulaspora globosa]QLL32432.1 hypothetical protein HG536_0C06010 [Torulaspora globosa]